MAKIKEEQLLEWAVKFYDMGFQAAIECVVRVASFAKRSKVEALQEYIEEQLKKDSS